MTIYLEIAAARYISVSQMTGRCQRLTNGLCCHCVLYSGRDGPIVSIGAVVNHFLSLVPCLHCSRCSADDLLQLAGDSKDGMTIN